MQKIKVYLVEERENPSTDFFVLPQFKSDDFVVSRCNFNEVVSAAELDGAIVVFVRYLPKAWRQLISQNRAILKALYFFMDDDVLDFNTSKGMPLRYRWKLLKFASFHKNWLLKQNALLWVSTPYLQNKYQAWSPRLIEPKPIELNKKMVKVFYHGSASHQAEIEWLLPVIKIVLERNSSVCFEIVGGQSVYKLFKGVPRVQVIHPMGWEAYQHFISQPGRHIGLAPLLDNAFNRARSYTKVFDITQAGAVGIYSEGSENARFIKKQSLEMQPYFGQLLPMNQELWADAIIELATHSILQEKRLKRAHSLVNDFELLK
jgi:hypothetical protein